MRPSSIILTLVGAAFIALLGLQAVPSEFPADNPPVEAPIEGPPEVVEILRRACYDCHSNQTEWPFYAHVAPASWWVREDVAGGRSRLNFSEWGDLRRAKKRRHAREIVERVEAGEMPLPRYLWLHPSARVSEEELAVLRRWRDSFEESTPAQENGGRISTETGGAGSTPAPDREEE